MSRILIISPAVLMCLMLSGSLSAQDADKKAAEEKVARDVLTDAVDPFVPGKERARFLKAAGVDTELDETEAKVNAKLADGFIRPFDKWSNLMLFDKNKDKKIDWFEANAYRRVVRAAILATYDKDGNKKLNGEEREKANKDLLAGKLPKISVPKASTSGDGSSLNNLPEPGRRPSAGNSNRPGNSGRSSRGGFGNFNSEEFTKKYDKDGDGKLSDTERRDAFTAMRAAAEKRRADYIKQYDKDGDGELDEEERRAARTAAWEKYKQENPERAAEIEKRRAEFVKQYDKDGDGELSSEERREAFRARWAQFRQDNPDRAAEMEKRREEFMNRFDKNGDGEINDDERAAIREYYRNRFGGRGRGEGDSGRSRGRGDGERSRRPQNDNKN